MNETIKSVGIVIISIITALGAVRIIIRVRKMKNSSNKSKVVQKGNVVGGDQAGRDIKK